MNREVLSHYDIMTVGEMSGVTIDEAIKYAGKKRRELNMVFQFDQDALDHDPDDKWGRRAVPLPELKKVFMFRLADPSGGESVEQSVLDQS